MELIGIACFKAITANVEQCPFNWNPLGRFLDAPAVRSCIQPHPPPLKESPIISSPRQVLALNQMRTAAGKFG